MSCINSLVGKVLALLAGDLGSSTIWPLRQPGLIPEHPKTECGPKTKQNKTKKAVLAQVEFKEVDM